MRACLPRAVLLLGLLCLAQLGWAQAPATIPPMDSPVVDTTGTLDAASRQALIDQALALQQRKGSQLQILMVPSTAPEDIAQYTQRVFEQWQIGRKGVDDGVLLVVAKDDRRVRIEPGYGLEGAIPDAIANRVIQEYLAPKFRSNDYAGGLTDATGALVKLIDGEALPAPVSDHRAARGGTGGGEGWPVALMIGFFVGTFLRGILGALPRPVRALLGGGGAALAAFLFTSLLLASGVAGLIGLFVGASSGRVGRFARNSGWGGGGWGGGGSGWGSGGGRSGGGGASGGW
jgi:uncharacterized protein